MIGRFVGGVLRHLLLGFIVFGASVRVLGSEGAFLAMGAAFLLATLFDRRER